MRSLIFVPLLALAACGGEEKAKAPAKAAAIGAGQWESTVEVENLQRMDAGEPKLNLPRGTRIAGGACIAEADAARPAPALFIGPPFECEYNNFYMRNGRMNIQMTCSHPDVDGDVAAMLDGRFTAEDFNGVLNLSTALPTDGDVIVSTRISGRRAGACTPAAAPAAEANQTR